MGPKILLISDFRKFTSSRPEAEIFISLAKKGASVTVMTFPENPFAEKLKAAGAKIIDFHPQKSLDREAIKFIRKELIRGKYDILQLNNSQAIRNGILAAKNLDVKVLLYRGSTSHIHWWNPLGYTKFFSPRVDKIICNSRGVEDAFHRQLFFDKSKTITINKGHKLEWYENVEPAELTDFGIPPGAFVCCCIANVRKFKGIPFLIKAMNYIPAELPIHLILIGNRMNSPKHLKLREKLKDPGKVHIHNFIPNPLGVVSASDVFVLSSLHSESITKAVIESMSLGTPPIITKIPGNKELVEDGENGLVVPPKNPKAIAKAIQYMYNHPEKIKEFGSKSIEKIKNELNHERTVQEMLDLYNRLKSASNGE